MSFRTTLAIIITVFLTVTIMQNTEETEFVILFVPVTLPKLVMLTAISASAFILGILVSRPRQKKVVRRYEDDQENDTDDEHPRRRPDTLSDEDREYIS
ncbi:hypothetical protein [Mucilaginibacter sp. PAMB04168]|uniref:hypothetical protein n=1 Tax=Mucilaginibacter sp. PAMB04168 TaxID=3138567 RepID=UPI0031F6CEB9